MKKKLIMVIVSMAMATGLAACGGLNDPIVSTNEESTSASAASEANDAESGDTVTDETTDASAEEDYYSEVQRQIMTAEIIDTDDLNGSFTLGEYKGLELTKTVTAVTDADVDSYLESLATAVEVEDADATVEEGDIADIAFVGKIDGEEFDGGSSESYDLTIGSGSFIDGFEDGLIGMKTGETRDLALTFPENYGDYSGMDVVFTVTINAIKRVPELTDDWAAEVTSGQFATIAEYRESVREELETQNDELAESTLQADAWTIVEENSTVLWIPQSYYDAGAEDFDSNVTSAAEQYGLTVDEYIAQVGIDEDSYNTQRDSYARYTAASKMLLDALVEAEEITEDSEEYREELTKVSELYGLDSEQLIQENGEETVRDYVLTQVVISRIVGYANVEVVTAEE